MKKLEEMNLLNDFLVNSLTGHRLYGEAAARYILECIFRRRIGRLTVVPQRFWQGGSTGKHGVRLDVYLDEEDGEIFDVEPDRNGGAEEITALPRRVRFYHAKIDAGNLAAGEDYRNLRNVIVIFITPYDPFGLGRMVYTVKNSCVEEPELVYNDGAKTLFLYTRGTKGEPPEELRLLLRYMEKSLEENAQTQELKKLHGMVQAVKRDAEVGLAYMKSFEREQRVREEAREEGREEGIVQGRAAEKAECILQVARRLGEIPEKLKRELLSETDPETLERWFQAALSAGSVEEFREKL